MLGKRGHRESPGRCSHTARAELSFSVSHMERLLREGHYAQLLSSSAPVYLVAIIQYLAARVLELARHEAQNSGRRRLTPELVDVAARSNALLSDLFRTIAPSPRTPDSGPRPAPGPPICIHHPQPVPAGPPCLLFCISPGRRELRAAEPARSRGGPEPVAGHVSARRRRPARAPTCVSAPGSA
ncbi:histone H2A-Bbd type 1 [Sagmatias obliquidens]|uniref:histone H2A-Bbd type 1 n=1 Tax=Sagmatias obliquidens TaxID=3371155 RepID=UPI000F442867|nr:histone H2A-Bbd type 2/3 [Lagenorhynchus obliquidens]